MSVSGGVCDTHTHACVSRSNCLTVFPSCSYNPDLQLRGCKRHSASCREPGTQHWRIRFHPFTAAGGRGLSTVSGSLVRGDEKGQATGCVWKPGARYSSVLLKVYLNTRAEGPGVQLSGA